MYYICKTNKIKPENLLINDQQKELYGKFLSVVPWSLLIKLGILNFHEISYLTYIYVRI